MTCEDFERDLALEIEGDLPSDAAVALEGHLRTCERCQAFRRSLERSQSWLKAAGAEPLTDGEVEALHRRVQVALRRPAVPAPLGGRWLWALAAGVALLVLALGIRRIGQTAPERPTQAAVAARVAAPELEAVRPVSPSPAETPQVRSRAHPRPKTATVAGRGLASPASSAWTGGFAAERLTAEEADQLARAVVLVSRLERVPEERPEPEERAERAPEALFVKLLTADPDVVIYCQIEQNGG